MNIAPTPELAPASSRRRSLWQRVLGNRFLFISIAVHLLLGLAATALVVQRMTAARKLTFKGGPPNPNPSTRALEHKVQMAKQKSTMSAPAMDKRITTKGLSKITLPDMPAMPKSAAAPAQMAGVGGTGVGSSIGAAGMPAAAAGGSAVTMFGLRDARTGGLMGTFYDLKQTAGGKPTEMAIAGANQHDAKEDHPNKTYAAELREFVKGNWNDSLLQKYFKGPNPLYTTQIFIPVMSAVEGPKAFDLADKVQPRRWVVIYKGKVTPPVSGKYIFVGSADDVIMVRFNGRVVLDGGIFNPTGEKPKGGYWNDGPSLPHSTKRGETFDVTAGKSYDIQILIGEIPGGGFHCWLLLEKEGETYAKGPRDNPVLPIFRLAAGVEPKPNPKAPVVGGDTAWSVWKSEKPGSTSALDIFHKP